MPAFVDREDSSLVILVAADEPDDVGLAGGRTRESLDSDQCRVARGIENDRTVGIACRTGTLEADQQAVALRDQLDDSPTLGVGFDCLACLSIGHLVLLHHLPAEQEGEETGSSRQCPSRAPQPEADTAGEGVLTDPGEELASGTDRYRLRRCREREQLSGAARVSDRLAAALAQSQVPLDRFEFVRVERTERVGADEVLRTVSSRSISLTHHRDPR